MNAHDPVVITAHRTLITSSASGAVEWTVNEFNRDGRVILSANSSGSTQFSAHFTHGQWAEFQALVAGGQS